MDSLCNLTNSRHLDISENEIEDISALFEMEFIEYLNLTGNNIPEIQIRKLKEKEVIIIH